MKELKVGVVGLGLGRFFVAACARSESVGRVTVCDPDTKRRDAIRKELPAVAQGYDGIEEMLEKERLDAVCVVTPDHLHRPHASLCLDAGCHVLMTKPLATNLEDGRAIVTAAEEKEKTLMVAHEMRFRSRFRKIKSLLDAGDLGEIILLQMNQISDKRGQFIRSPWYASDQAGRTAIVGTGIHLIDTVLSFFSKPARITSHRTTDADGARCEAILEFSDGGRGIVAIEPAAGIVEESYELIGPDYRLFADTHHDSLTIHEEDKLVYSWSAPDYTASHVLSGCYYETEAFLRAVAGLEPYTPTLAEAVATIETAEALHRV